MTYVIAETCTDVLDRACVKERPVEAIFYEGDVPPRWSVSVLDNTHLFEQPSPGQNQASGSSGGATKVRPIAVDTPFVPGYPTPVA